MSNMKTAEELQLESEFELMFQKLSEQGGYHAIILNAYGDLEAHGLSEEEFQGWDWESYVLPSTKKYWVVSRVRPGETFSEHVTELELAVQFREHFYSERQTEYGPSAWPTAKKKKTASASA